MVQRGREADSFGHPALQFEVYANQHHPFGGELARPSLGLMRSEKILEGNDVS